MPLIARCEKCGQEVQIYKIQELKKVFIIEYECLKCKLRILEEIPKRQW